MPVTPEPTATRELYPCLSNALCTLELGSVGLSKRDALEGDWMELGCRPRMACGLSYDFDVGAVVGFPPGWVGLAAA